MPVSIVRAMQARPVYLIRNADRRRFSLGVAGEPAVAAFLHRQDAARMQSILESHHRLTGEWPDFSAPQSLWFREDPVGPEQLLAIEEEDFDAFVEECTRHYVRYILVSSFGSDGGPTTQIKGTVIKRDPDESYREYLKRLFEA